MTEELAGPKLAEAAQLTARVRDPDRSGVEIKGLVRAPGSSGIRIAGDDPLSTFRSALNNAQDIWVRVDDRRWRWIEKKQQVRMGISGKAPSDVIYASVRNRYPNARIFRYEQTKEELLRRGTRIKGSSTGPAMRAALTGSPDRFEPLGRGMWRWK